jgi:uncharacterized DUF497 family protein
VYLASTNFCHYVKSVRVTFDPAKRALTLEHRGLDFADAALVFAGRHFTRRDDRRDYGEDRFITTGYAAGRFVVLVWTPRNGARRIISMRFGHADEEAHYQDRMG